MLVVVGGMGTKQHYAYVFERHQIRKAVGKFAIIESGEIHHHRKSSGNSSFNFEVRDEEVNGGGDIGGCGMGAKQHIDENYESEVREEIMLACSTGCNQTYETFLGPSNLNCFVRCYDDSSVKKKGRR